MCHRTTDKRVLMCFSCRGMDLAVSSKDFLGSSPSEASGY